MTPSPRHPSRPASAPAGQTSSASLLQNARLPCLSRWISVWCGAGEAPAAGELAVTPSSFYRLEDLYWNRRLNADGTETSNTVPVSQDSAVREMADEIARVGTESWLVDVGSRVAKIVVSGFGTSGCDDSPTTINELSLPLRSANRSARRIIIRPHTVPPAVVTQRIPPIGFGESPFRSQKEQPRIAAPRREAEKH